MLEHLLRVRVFPLAIRVFGIEVVFGQRWHEGCFHALLTQTIPVKVVEPWMFPQNMRSLLPETVTRLPLDQSVDKISSICRPVLRNFILMDFDLFRKDMITNLFSVLAMVRPLAEHTLIGDDSHSEVVDGYTVVLAAHDLGSHIAGRARCVLRVLRIPQTCNTQIRDPQVAILVEDQVLWLDITMQDCILVKIFEAKEHASDKELYNSN